MDLERQIHLYRVIFRIAGLFIILSMALAHYHHPNWIYFTLFVGANLFQFSFTKFCPMEMILKKMGVGLKKS